jgi:hypothetical protein
MNESFIKKTFERFFVALSRKRGHFWALRALYPETGERLMHAHNPPLCVGLRARWHQMNPQKVRQKKRRTPRARCLLVWTARLFFLSIATLRALPAHAQAPEMNALGSSVLASCNGLKAIAVDNVAPVASGSIYAYQACKQGQVFLFRFSKATMALTATSSVVPILGGIEWDGSGIVGYFLLPFFFFCTLFL